MEKLLEENEEKEQRVKYLVRKAKKPLKYTIFNKKGDKKNAADTLIM